jgi:hypothetical protein
MTGPIERRACGHAGQEHELPAVTLARDRGVALPDLSAASPGSGGKLDHQPSGLRPRSGRRPGRSSRCAGGSSSPARRRVPMRACRDAIARIPAAVGFVRWFHPTSNRLLTPHLPPHRHRLWPALARTASTCRPRSRSIHLHPRGARAVSDDAGSLSTRAAGGRVGRIARPRLAIIGTNLSQRQPGSRDRRRSLEEPSGVAAGRASAAPARPGISQGAGAAPTGRASLRDVAADRARARQGDQPLPPLAALASPNACAGFASLPVELPARLAAPSSTLMLPAICPPRSSSSSP